MWIDLVLNRIHLPPSHPQTHGRPTYHIAEANGIPPNPPSSDPRPLHFPSGDFTFHIPYSYETRLKALDRDRGRVKD